MSWADSLLEASWRGVPIDIVRTTDATGRSVATHAYPWVDGADLEDLGRDARRVTLEVIVWGAQYEQALRLLIEALDAPGAGELVHPVFGARRMQVRRHDVRHDADAVDQATLTIEFEECRDAPALFSGTSTAQQVGAIAAHGDRAVSAAAEAAGRTVDRLRGARPLAVLDALRAQLVGPLQALRREISNVVTSGLDVLAFPRAWVADVDALVDGVVDARRWVSTTLGADFLAVQRSLARVPLAIAGRSALVQVPRMTAGAVPSEDQARAAAQSVTAVVRAKGLAAAAQALFAVEATAPSLTTAEIERVANAVRADLDDAIERTRAIYATDVGAPTIDALRDLAAAVQSAAGALIEARPPLVVRVLEAPGSLRLIAHHLYGDHTRAPELWRLNSARGLRRPNHLTRGDRLHAYAA
jgi:prophage DNA circulation protein